MTVADERPGAAATATAEPGAPSVPAGPVGNETPVRMPPARSQSKLAQTLRFSVQPLESALRARAAFGDVWQVNLLGGDQPFVLTSHPDHVESLFRAKPADAPSLTGESPLRPILGPNSVLTAVGEQHMRRRKLLLPPFHGEAVARYVDLIADVVEREIDAWPVGRRFALAPRMLAVTLEVIMAGVFGLRAPQNQAVRRTGCAARYSG